MSEPSEAAFHQALDWKERQLEDLMLRYQQADRAAAEQFMQELAPILNRFFLANPDDRQSAPDLVQETLLRLHKARHTYRGSEPLLPWVFAIARHVRVDQYRRRSRIAQREKAVEAETLQATVPSKEASVESSPDFEKLMQFLPPSQREVLTMLKVLGMSVEEVAQITSSTAGSVKQKAHRAYNQLRSILQKSRPPSRAAKETR
jgi:RNA polymerase sigma-70 factor, ECF subfamily